MRNIATFLLALTTSAIGVAAQQDFAAFRATVEQRLRAPFFSRVTMTLVEYPPFLFCIERPAAVDDKDYEGGGARLPAASTRTAAAVGTALPRPRPALTLRAEAGGYALAVLANAGAT
ncbi:MAG: hypothetical protein U5M23_09215 [Marinagarivorans sp.]|nr:hypothetical protein [Marinagarivorans sp.]